MERKLLSAISKDREFYATILPLLKQEDFSQRGYEIYKLFDSFYQNDAEAKHVDIDLVKEECAQKYPKHSQEFHAVLDRLEDVSIPNFSELFVRFKKEAAKNRLAQALVSDDNVEEYLEEYLEIRNVEDDLSSLEESSVYVGESLDTLLQTVDKDNLIKVYPSALNERLGGGVPPETHIMLFSPTETGKSAFAINMACGFLVNDRKVLYVGNEDPHSMMLLRFYNRLTGMTRYELFNRRDEAREIATSKGYNNLIMASLSPGSIPEIRKLIDKWEPEVLVVDQLANLNAGKEEGVYKLDKLAREVRSLTKEYGLVTLSIHQAGESAFDRVHLSLGDMYGSNVALQAQVDVLLGMGADDTYKRLNRRMVSVLKNKISGDKRPFIVQLNEPLSKITSVV